MPLAQPSPHHDCPAGPGSRSLRQLGTPAGLRSRDFHLRPSPGAGGSVRHASEHFPRTPKTQPKGALPSSGEYRRSGQQGLASLWNLPGTTRRGDLDLTFPSFISSQVRRQLPTEEPNIAKRVLFLLLTVVFCQILMAEEGVSQTLAAEDATGAASPEPISAPITAPPFFEPFNLTSESSDYALDLKAFLQQHPAAF